MSAGPGPVDATTLCGAVEELRCTQLALLAAATGITGSLSTSDQGEYFLLMAVAEKLDRAVSRLETLVGHRT